MIICYSNSGKNSHVCEDSGNLFDLITTAVQNIYILWLSTSLHLVQFSALTIDILVYFVNMCYYHDT